MLKSKGPLLNAEEYSLNLVLNCQYFNFQKVKNYKNPKKLPRKGHLTKLMQKGEVWAKTQRG